MSSITITDVSQELLARLRAAAARDHRSLNQEALELLEGGLASREVDEDRVRSQVAAWRALAGEWVSVQTFEDEVSELYAGRTEGRDTSL